MPQLPTMRPAAAPTALAGVRPQAVPISQPPPAIPPLPAQLTGKLNVKFCHAQVRLIKHFVANQIK